MSRLARTVRHGILISLLCAPAFGKERPSYDAATVSSARGSGHGARSATGTASGHLSPGLPLHVDTLRDVPSFLWAGLRGRSDLAPGQSLSGRSAETAARKHLAEYAPLYRLDLGDTVAAEMKGIHDTGRGGIVVSFRQRLDGVEIFREEIRLLMDRDLNLVSIAGAITGRSEMARLAGPGGSRGFPHDATVAAAFAVADQTGSDVDAADLRVAGAAPGGFTLLGQRHEEEAFGGEQLLTDVRAKRVYFRTKERLEPAWYLEVETGQPETVESALYAFVVASTDGRILFRHNLTASDSFSYRVWADPTGAMTPHDGPQGTGPTPHPTGITDGYQAPFTAPALVTLQNGPISTNDPWLAPGETVTIGNNADAYVDIFTPDGFSAGDLRATTTSPGVFDRTYDTSLPSSTSSAQRMASVTQLFYDVNFLHDWFYDAGFDEASGNAQADNYGRGGLGFDSMKAEGQDSSGRNNANMSTPSDGGKPRMQMYIFDGIGRRLMTVTAPAGIAADYSVGTATFGALAFSTPGMVAEVNDGSTAGTGGTLTDGCQTPFTNAAQVSGKIALIDRGGGCAFSLKTKNAQLNGAIGTLIVNNAAGLITMSGTDATITIPALMISTTDGALIRAQLGGGVSATLIRDTAIERDGTLDNQIVAHEWGHYISNRLIGNATGLSNTQGGGMGEGWGDFHSMMLSVRPEDATATAGLDYTGVYGMAGYVRSGGPNGPTPNQGYYFGIRRFPYSIDFTKNPLTLRHIANGVVLPAGVPISFGADGVNNAEVHNSGEVWATMLWECYAALLRDSGRLTFDQAQQRMTDYLVAGYKMTPNAPTFLEARDAILAAALASDPSDHALLAQAFARRGAGVRAVAPDRFSTTNIGVVESYAMGGDLALESASLIDDIASCDGDGLLDDGETGTLTVTLRNAGTGPLTATSLTVSSPNPGVSFPSGEVVSMPASSPLGTTTSSLTVLLSGVSGQQALDFDITFDDPGFAVPGAMTTRFSRRGNLDESPGISATDDVESSLPTWTESSSPPVPPAAAWRRLEVTGYDHRWAVTDPGSAFDLTLTSPLLAVGLSPFSVTFSNRYAFEFSGGTFYDGGVIEINVDGSSIWSDIGAMTAPGYGGSLAFGGGNPIEGRLAFVANSPGYPAFGLTTVSLGTSYAGQAVRVRFRVGSDLGVGAPGWDIDNIVFSGLTNLPFPALTPQAAACTDSDFDGVPNVTDCAPIDPTVWGVPGAVADLDATGDALTTLSWIAPAAPGASVPRYDLLRSDLPQFAGASCLESDDIDLMGEDPTTPGTIYFYLVRVETPCGSSLGTDSSGGLRTAPPCP